MEDAPSPFPAAPLPPPLPLGAAGPSEEPDARHVGAGGYRGLLDSLAELVYIQDLEGRFLDVNEAVVRAYGYARHELVGKTPDFLGVPGTVDPEAFAETFGRAVAGEPQRFEWWGRRKDGSTFPKEVTIQRATHFGADVVVAVARDVTERVEAEAALRRSEEHFRRLTEHASDLISILDAEGVVRYQSPAIEPMLGYTPEELLGQNAFAYLAPEDVGPTLEGFRRALESPGTSVAVEFRFRHRDGSWRTLESIGTTLDPASAAEGVVVNSRDVTERKAAERALRESEALKHAVVTSALDAIISVDGDGRIVAFNPAAERLLGHRAEAVLGQPMAERIIPPRFRAAHDAGMARYRETREARVMGQRLEVAALRADGTEFPAELALAAVHLEDGREVFTAFLHDITRRKEAEAALKRHTEALEAARHEAEQAREQASRYARSLEHSLEELRAAQDRLVQQEKLASLGRLTAGVAHEIKNPLNFIVNFAGLTIELAADLRGALDAGDAAHAAELLADIAQNARKVLEHGRRADAIVQGMTAHARGGPDERTGPRRPVDLNALVEAQVGRLDGAVAVTRDYGPDVGAVEADPEELGRVVHGLLANALDAAEERAAQEPGAFTPAVTVRTRRDGAAVTVAVSDNGYGVAEAVRGQVFEPFFTTKPAGSGHPGLGLSLAHEIVAKGYGGWISVGDAEGEGATFTVTLPAPPGVGARG